jgi:hypothetical protein
LTNVADRQNYDFYDSMMIMIKKCLNLDLQDYRMLTPHVIPSQDWAVRLIEKESRGRKLTKLPKKLDRLDLQDYTNYSPLEKGAGGID